MKNASTLFIGMASVTIMLLSPTLAAAADPPIWAPPQLAALVEEGLRENYDIRSLEAEVESLEDEISFAGSLEDPRLGLALLNLPADSFQFDREPMTQKQVSIAQKFPWFGKLDLRSQRAAMKVVRQEALLKAKRLELARDIAAVFYDLSFTAEALSINVRMTREVDQLLRVAETRYATGGGLQQDVLQAQVEMAKLLDEKIMLEKRRRVLQDRLNELLNRERFEPVAPAPGLPLMALDLNIERLQSRALEENPEVAVRKTEIRIADIEVELARKAFWPDFDVQLAYGQREEDRTGRDLPDFVSGTVMLNIPVWQGTRQRPKLAAALKTLAAARQSHQALLAALPHRIDALGAEIQDTQRNYRLFKDALLLQAEQWARSSMSAYEVGSVEFSTMIAARLQQLRFELQADRYLFEVYKSRAELEKVVGGAIDSE